MKPINNVKKLHFAYNKEQDKWISQEGHIWNNEVFHLDEEDLPFFLEHGIIITAEVKENEEVSKHI